MNDALRDDDWCKAMEEEIEQIEKNKTWTFFPRPVDKNVIGTKGMFRNKLDENGEITKNKARLVCKGMHKKKDWIMGKHFPLLQEWKELGLYLHMLPTKVSKSTKWM